MSTRPVSTRRRQNTSSIYDIEEELNGFVIGLYQKDQRGYRNWRQRALLVTLLDSTTIQEDMRTLADKITILEGTDNAYFTEVISESEFIEAARDTRPQDSAIISIGSPLVIAKRSPKTGKYYWSDDFQYCPEEGVPLRYVVQSSNNGKGICPELTQ